MGHVTLGVRLSEGGTKAWRQEQLRAYIDPQVESRERESLGMRRLWKVQYPTLVTHL